ncbi:Peroxisomal biogenesis factor 6 [Phytophthora cactorum]|uniref:Peroxisomal ATPase PEX6 n=1 Tax=Phytophthora cactorum TaxID=29920 RepID=A0A8T1FI42_9STRA|nr:Peroxisomal biogenesis factor 6 [Phytophthora cactorum]KAG2972943.1 Peroxisomal biogenesis factor 6 [Phytophthora cactorum]KAG3006487.1 Peroxisomal biogenesis factor 6 [Phytophthora cactorum]KAG3216318.1 Peroxisomal biogenesis factor 6 [Phytophthora cactorum]
MWLSSFAVNAAPEQHVVCAHVWSLRSSASSSSLAAVADDALALATTSDVSLLRRLRVVHDSFVTLQFQERRHVARLCLLPKTIVDANEEQQVNEVGDVTLSPLLAFNIGIPLHSSTATHMTVSLSIRAAVPQELGLAVQPSAPFRRKHQEQPAAASYAMITPLLVSSLSCHQHTLLQQRDGLLDAIRAYFATPKVMQVGDIFAVELRETTQSHVPKENKWYRENYVPYKAVEVPAACMKPKDDEATEPVTELMPPTLDLDTSLMFFRVEKLDGDNKDALALTVSDATELMQGSSTSAPSPDETTIKQFMTQSRYRGAAPAFDSALPFNTQQELYEVLYPAQLCEIPVSVLLSGARGVGKTTLVHQVAKQLGVITVEVPFTELTGQSELHLLENVRDQVSKAQALSPCLLYISHLFPVEKDNEEAELRIGAVLSECIRSLSQNQHSIPLIACVEDVNEVPKFIRQCFLYEMHLEAPDLSKRLEFLQHLAASIELGEDVDLTEIAQLTAGRTYGELSAMLADAGSLSIERILGDETDTSEVSLEDLVFTDSDDLPLKCSVSAKDMEESAQNQQAQASSANIGNASIPNVKWTDVGGLEDVKDEILDVVQLPIKHPELFASGVRQRSGILLYGPPGTGKTLLAKAIATECNLNFLSVKGPELLNMYIGESEKNVRQVFAKARSCRPCILFFDELDSLAPMRGRGSDSGGVMDRVVSQLLTEIDGLSGGGNDQVFVIGATNRPDLLETGLLRPGRFDRLLYLGICNEKSAQLKVLKAQTRKFTLAEDADLDAVVEHCPTNFTGADFYALSSSALAAALKDRVEALDRQLEEINAEDCYSSSPMTIRLLLNRLSPEELRVPVSQEHFMTALSQVVPSVSPAEIQHYENLKKQQAVFGGIRVLCISATTCRVASSNSGEGHRCSRAARELTTQFAEQSRAASRIQSFSKLSTVVYMVRFISYLALTIGSASAASSTDQTWCNQFKSKLDILPKASGDCSVCFYEQVDYAGPKFCVGKRVKSCTRANPITAPGTIGSIKFGSGCNLVANVRVTDVPFDEHVDVISKDVANTGYNVSGDHSVQQVYVEEAGRACLLGIPDSGDGYGVCYTDSVPEVETKYWNAITELMLFKSDAKDFDVILYENQDYNDPQKSAITKDVAQGTGAMSYRFTGYSKTLETNVTSSSGMKQSLQNKVRSVQFVSPENDATQTDSTPGSVAPAAYSV